MSEKRHRGRRLEVRMRTRATPEAVWEAWADPEKIAHWFVDRARGKPEVGSTFTWIFEKFGYEIPYEVVASEPGKRFALGGEAPKSGPFLLEVTIAREGGETVVTLVNSGFLDGAEWDEEFEGIVSGWTSALAILKHYLENYAGRPKQTLLVMQPAVYEYARLLPFYATAEGLDRWLTTAASIGGLGESVRAAPGGRREPDRPRPVEDRLGSGRLLRGDRRRAGAQGLPLPRCGQGGRRADALLGPPALARLGGISPGGAPAPRDRARQRPRGVALIGQAISLVGAAMILAAFAAQQAGKLGGEDRAYLVLNLFGSLILTYFAVEAKNSGLIVLEGSWAVISLVSLVRSLAASPPRSGGAAS